MQRWGDDGTTIDTGATVRALLVGGDGVFFVRFDPEDDDGRFVGATFLHPSACVSVGDAHVEDVEQLGRVR